MSFSHSHWPFVHSYTDIQRDTADIFFFIAKLLKVLGKQLLIPMREIKAHHRFPFKLELRLQLQVE